MSSNKPFGCHVLFTVLTKCIKFMKTYILQYEISLKTKMFKSRSWPTFMGYDLIDIILSNMDLKTCI